MEQIVIESIDFQFVEEYFQRIAKFWLKYKPFLTSKMHFITKREWMEPPRYRCVYLYGIHSVPVLISIEYDDLEEKGLIELDAKILSKKPYRNIEKSLRKAITEAFNIPQNL